MTAGIGTAADTSVEPLPAQLRADLTGAFWHKGCPTRSPTYVFSPCGTGGSTAGPTPASSSSTSRPRRRSRRSSGSSMRCGSRSGRCSCATSTCPTARARPTTTSADRSNAGRRCRRRASAARGPARGRTTPTGSRSTSTRARTPTSGAARRATRPGRLPRPLAPPPRHGHPGGHRRVRLDRLGLGRVVVRLDEGLHALLAQRPLALLGPQSCRPAEAGQPATPRACVPAASRPGQCSRAASRR